MGAYTVLFERIGRHENPEPLVVAGDDSLIGLDKIARQIAAYVDTFVALPGPADRAASHITMNLSAGVGAIGGGRYGRFVITPSDLKPVGGQHE